MPQNSECEFCRNSLAYSMFFFNFNDLTTVNFNKITITIVKHFKVLTHTIICPGEMITSL